MKTSSKVIIWIIVLAAIGLGAFAWHQHTSPAAVKPAASTQASASASPASVSVKVFFSKHPQSDNDPSATFAVKRTSPDAGVGKFSISQLLAGPTAAETSAGYFTPGITMTGASTCGGQDFSLNITSQTATLQFCRATALKGVVSDGQLNSEITATLRQFSTVSKVVILNQSGHCLFDASGQDLCKR